MSFKEYSLTLPLARKIYLSIFDEPTTHKEWAAMLNKTGEINKIIINEKRGN